MSWVRHRQNRQNRWNSVNLFFHHDGIEIRNIKQKNTTTSRYKQTDDTTMIPIAAVRSSNEGIRAFIPGLTALFVGGATTGVGRSTLHQLALRAHRPNAYIVDRSEAAAAPFLARLRQLNPEGRWTFVETDVSLVRNVDAACAFVGEREKRVNLLFMTPEGGPVTWRRRG
ncbi:hypothetical protein VTN02DRAFT_629 [Thermoascus thermophilus]